MCLQYSEFLVFNKPRSAAFQIRYQVSRFSRHFLASFLKGVKCRVPEGLYRSLRHFSLFKNSTLADKVQFTFDSSLCTISSSFWCHTYGENSDTYGGTNQQQQVSHCLPVCLVRRSTCKLSLTFQDKVQL